MPEQNHGVAVLDTRPRPADTRAEVLDGLRRPQKTLPSKYFYDERGSRLFDEITRLPEYYLTRTELDIMTRYVAEMAACLGPRCLLVEYGSGSSLKTRILLDHLPDVAAYVPVDISRAHLEAAAARLAEEYPGLRILPVCADYTASFELPDPGVPFRRVAVYFPGSTIGNFTPEEARAFLERIAGVAGPGGGLLIGVDLRKDPAVIEPAYNDARGVTAAFNRNILVHLNRLLGAGFDPEAFAHHAFFNEAESRVEMHLVSLKDQCVRLDGEAIPIRRGETILTEYSYKYTPEAFATLAESAGFRVERVWTDEARYFSVQYLCVR
ncbi:L-histidine N(alpha)-methyltransferase [Rhodocaloribacter litoris]|uniref:L-histidine N(alpha)-methyltransferase n=1 Tax=Rhodocaloribacter litoris TaxID=2558931 RepID=UPI001422F454|nr:L-histidine N(alpha)-methyltransferase [Rhodocaloribacter litoris]QXD14621.1 L-histidine N(alpha)-methyltransferase [Rhodocaloribacter litoris]